MTRIIVYPYNMASQSARELKDFFLRHRLRSFCVRPNGRYRPRRDDFIINWGNGHPPTWGETIDRLQLQSLNMAHLCHSVSISGNKLLTFHALNGAIPVVNIPLYTTSRDVASTWIAARVPVIARRDLRGSAGRGISYHVYPEALPVVPLYTQYIKKMTEFRIHVFLGEIIDEQQKKRDRHFPGFFDYRIRSHSRGWIFAREAIRVPEDVRTQAQNAVIALGLDFGAVDVVYNAAQRRAYVLEINTAPGLEGTTIERYGQAVLDCL